MLRVRDDGFEENKDGKGQLMAPQAGATATSTSTATATAAIILLLVVGCNSPARASIQRNERQIRSVPIALAAGGCRGGEAPRLRSVAPFGV